MQVVSSGTYQGIGKFNNDIINHVGDMCYVMDGASALFDDNVFFETSDLYEYMRLLRKNIQDNSSIVVNFKNGIENSNNELTGIEKYNEYELPTYTISAIKEYDNYFEVYLLCDCLVSILYKNKTIENIEDNRFNKIKFECRKEISKIDKLDLDIEEKLKLKRPIWREYRKYANKENGYPVGSTNKNSIEQGIIKRIKKENVDKILICSDGLYSQFGIPNDIKYFTKQHLESLIQNNKNHDDLSYYLIENK